MIKGKTKAKILFVSGLHFRGVVRMVENNWEAEPSSVCMTCCGKSYEWIKDCGDKTVRCIIYADLHQIEEHQCEVVGYKKDNRKICIHITVIYTNCGDNHTANLICCTSRHKVNLKA